MGYKKDMSKYEYLEGWERCSFGEQLKRVRYIYIYLWDR